MLVLSRSEKQGIVFPGLGITVEILDAGGKRVKVGIDAPPEIRVLRSELMPNRFDSETRLLQSHLQQVMQDDPSAALRVIGACLQTFLDQAEAEKHEDRVTADPLCDEIMQQIATTTRGSSSNCDWQNSESNRASDTARTALIVDDHENERELLAGYLRLCSYKVFTSGSQNMDAIGSLPILDYVILNTDENGHIDQELLSELRSNCLYEKTHIFTLSNRRPSEKEATESDEFIHQLCKPLDPRELVDAMTVLEEQQQIQFA